MRLTGDPAVLTLWGIALALTVLVIVPVAVYLLHRTWQAARDIRRFAADTLRAGRGTAAHTAKIPALDRTVELAGPIVETASGLRRGAAELEETLRERVG